MLPNEKKKARPVLMKVLLALFVFINLVVFEMSFAEGLYYWSLRRIDEAILPIAISAIFAVNAVMAMARFCGIFVVEALRRQYDERNPDKDHG